MSLLSALKLLSRRQSLSLAVWAVVGASCGPRHSNQPAAAPPGHAAAAPIVPPPPPVPAEFAGLSHPVALQFYHQRGWRPAWNPDQSAALTRSLGDARRHALERVDFAPKTTPGGPAIRQDIELTLAALRYAQALAFGHVDPRSIEKIFTLERNTADLAAGLEQALSGSRVADWLASLPPSDEEYQALSAAYVRGSVRQAKPAPEPDQDASPASPPPETAVTPKASPQTASPPTASPESPPPQEPPAPTPPADNAPPAGGAPASAASQSAPSPDAASQSASPNAASPNPASAASTGAPSESVSDESPPKRRAAPPTDHARQLAVNLERRRWLARTPPERRIDVNTAGCFLTYLKPGADPWTARVVLGKKGHETPSLQASFSRLVANPPWRVPADIARKEIFPKGGGYLRREHMRVVGGQVVQEPGPNSSLGLVKFDMQDAYAIYLHDTPSKALFALPERHKSHGCVRVQDAVGFARRLAGQAGRLDAFNAALASGKTREVDLGEAVPVRLLYHTAHADAGGQVAIFPDVYGWNDKLAAALGFRATAANASGEAPDVDLGP